MKTPSLIHECIVALVIAVLTWMAGSVYGLNYLGLFELIAFATFLYSFYFLKRYGKTGKWVFATGFAALFGLWGIGIVSTISCLFLSVVGLGIVRSMYVHKSMVGLILDGILSFIAVSWSLWCFHTSLSPSLALWCFLLTQSLWVFIADLTIKGEKPSAGPQPSDGFSSAHANAERALNRLAKT